MPITSRYVTRNDNLEMICNQIQPEKWDEENDMQSYKLEYLSQFLSDEKNILLLAEKENVIVGVALAYILLQPDGNHNLYLHELDTHPDHRRQGIATLLLESLKSYSKEKGLNEFWVGTEDDNENAQKLYEKQNPDEIEKAIIYTYKSKN